MSQGYESYVNDTSSTQFLVSTKNTPDRGWETMVFLSEGEEVVNWDDKYQERHGSREEAYKRHKKVVEMVSKWA